MQISIICNNYFVDKTWNDLFKPLFDCLTDLLVDLLYMLPESFVSFTYKFLHLVCYSGYLYKSNILVTKISRS